MQTKAIRKLLLKYKKGHCTPEEQAMLEKWYEQWHIEEWPISEKELEDIEAKMFTKLPHHRRTSFGGKQAWMIAAASLIFLLIGVSFYTYFSRPSAQAIKTVQIKDLDPGADRAVLTLANGKQIDLDHIAVGEIVNQEGFHISKTSDGQLIYRADAEFQSTKGNDTAYHTITTPRGGQFQLFLPDGTRVWLNAASSLRYPLTFDEEERKVQLIGEAYFEVAKEDKLKPFIVQTTNQHVMVLGTSFNINAYENEANTKTTLLSGRVKVMSDHEAIILQPNQQSSLESASSQIQVKIVDPAETVAWKNGQFLFNNTDLKTIMRQLERWYDVEVVGLDELPHYTYNGKIKRSSRLSKILQILELTSGVQFKIEADMNGKERRMLLIK